MSTPTARHRAPRRPSRLPDGPDEQSAAPPEGRAAAADSPALAGSPVLADSPLLAGTPVLAGSPVLADSPAYAESTASADDTARAGDPAFTGGPALTDGPVFADSPAFADGPAPAHEDAPGDTDRPGPTPARDAPATAPAARRDTVRRFRPYSSGLGGSRTLGLLLPALAPLPLAAGLWAFARLVDDVLVPGSWSRLAPLTGAVVAGLLLGLALDAAGTRLTARAHARFARTLDAVLVAHLQRLPLRRRDSRRADRTRQDVPAVCDLVVTRRARAVRTVTRLLVLAALALVLSLPLGAVTVAATVLVAVAARIVARRAGPRTGLPEAIGTLTLVGTGSVLLTSGAVTLGVLLTEVTALILLLVGTRPEYGPVDLPAAHRVLTLLDEPPAVAERAEVVRIGRARGELRIDGVTFTPPEAGSPALAEVSLTLPPGATVAVVGSRGSGRTTLASLPLRLADPGLGRVLLDGHDLRDLALEDLHRNVVAVRMGGDPAGTVREAIVRADPGATGFEIEEAAREAGVHDIVSALPQGYDTPVAVLADEVLRRGIVLAEAFLRDAPVVVLDEPTAGLDPAGTELLRAPLQRLLAGRTALLVSEDEALLAGADRIVHLDGGRITATWPTRPAGADRFGSTARVGSADRSESPVAPDQAETTELPQVEPDSWTVQMQRPLTGPTEEPALSRYALPVRHDPVAAAPTVVFGAVAIGTPGAPTDQPQARIDTMDVRGAGPAGTAQ
ncbi:hypothetical protein GCM10009836_51940 [Pseudonocardia ailaonensis]|uniref:ABC transporter domain-containing protein n=1 Tax=Pseudonocardia ailaonensis TaxID=367279 RepID=A0ABN2NE47_9PSEU